MNVTGTSTLTGNVTAKGDVLVEGELDVNRRADFLSDVTIGGTLSAQQMNLQSIETNDLTVANNITAGKQISAATLSTTQNATVGSNLTVTTDASVGQDLTVTRNANIGGTLQSGAATLDSASVTNGLTVGGNSTITGTFQSGAATLDSANVTNNLTVGGKTTTQTFESTGVVTVGTDLSVGGNSTIAGTLQSGAATLASVNSAGNITSTAEVQGATLKSTANTTVGQDLEVKGAAHVVGDLTVDGTINCPNLQLGVPDDINCNSVTTAAGVTVGTDLSVGGVSTLKNTTVGGTLDVTGNSTLKNTTANGTLNVTGATTLANTSVGGTLGVTGQASTKGISNIGLLAQNGSAAVTVNDGTIPLRVYNRNNRANVNESNIILATRDTIADAGEHADIIFGKANVDNECGILKYIHPGKVALGVKGAATPELEINDTNVKLSKATVIDGDLSVNGTTNFGDISATNFNVTNNLTVGGTSALGNITGSGLTTTGRIVCGNLQTDWNTQVRQDLLVERNATVRGNVLVGDASRPTEFTTYSTQINNGTFTNNGDATVNGKFTATLQRPAGASSWVVPFNNFVTNPNANDYITYRIGKDNDNGLAVAWKNTQSGQGQGSLGLFGSSDIITFDNSTIRLNKNTDVNGNTTINGTERVTGAATFNNDITVNGNIVGNSRLTINGQFITFAHPGDANTDYDQHVNIMRGNLAAGKGTCIAVGKIREGSNFATFGYLHDNAMPNGQIGLGSVKQLIMWDFNKTIFNRRIFIASGDANTTEPSIGIQSGGAPRAFEAFKPSLTNGGMTAVAIGKSGNTNEAGELRYTHPGQIGLAMRGAADPILNCDSSDSSVNINGTVYANGSRGTDTFISPINAVVPDATTTNDIVAVSPGVDENNFAYYGHRYPNGGSIGVQGTNDIITFTNSAINLNKNTTVLNGQNLIAGGLNIVNEINNLKALL